MLRSQGLGCAFLGMLMVPLAAGATDLGVVRGSDGVFTEPANSIGIEVSPSFFATNEAGHAFGNYDDTSIKLTLAHRFPEPFEIEGSLKDDIKQHDRHQFYAESRIGYRFEFGRFSLKPSAALGVTWNDTGFGPKGASSAAYYAAYLAGDVELSKKLTWNLFDVRYRDAFDYVWVTPEVSTGLTYRLTQANQIYGSTSYSWKGSGDRLHGDTFSVALGVEHGF
jgi:hypothetical protein